MPVDVFSRLKKENESINFTLRRLQVSSQRSEIAGAFPRLDFADLPTPGKEGRVIYVKDGQKQGEGSGAGTGVGAYDDGTAWRRFCDDTTVTASGSAIDYVILSPATSARNVVQPTGAAVIPFILRGFAGQTVPLQEWQDDSGVAHATISVTDSNTLLDLNHQTQSSLNNPTIGLSTTYTGTAGEIARAIGITFSDERSTANLSSQVIRLIYNRAAGASAIATVFDSSIDLRTVMNESHAGQFRTINIEGPVIAASKTLSDYRAIFIDDKGGAGTLTTQYGIYIDNLNGATTNYGLYITGASSEAARIITGTATAKGIVVRGAAAQSANLQEWQNSAGTLLSAIDSTGAFEPVTLTDASAPNNSIYFSSTASKLVYKDTGGTVNNLY